MATPNAFETFADEKIPRPVKARLKAARKRTEAIIESRVEDEACLREWLQWRRQEVTEALAGPHGGKLAALIAYLKRAQWNEIEAAAIVTDWAGFDRDTRALVLRIVSAFILVKRLDAGLVPFDDSLPF